MSGAGHPPRRTGPTLRESYWNARYNRSFIRRNDLLVPSASSPQQIDSRPFQTVWLRNIDRLIRMAHRNGTDASTASFLDVGCGAGIASLYAGSRYPFVSTGGFDLDAQLVEAARRNARRMGLSARFWMGDAREELLPEERLSLFLFNPFGDGTAEALLEQNAAKLSSTGSIALLANDHVLHVFLEFGQLLERDDHWNCSVVAFR